jgi:hypothetical protein
MTETVGEIREGMGFGEDISSIFTVKGMLIFGVYYFLVL